MKVKIPVTVFAAIVTIVFASVTVLALSAKDIKYPVAELGNCESEFKCGVYCGDPAHKAGCDAFIEKYNLDEKADKIKEITFPIAELGNCGSRAECESFCSQPNNVEACLKFAKGHNLVKEEEKERIDTQAKMGKLIAEGKTPGGCGSQEACMKYCIEGASHFDECINFLEDNKIMPEKALKYFKERRSFKFEGPGGCTDEKSCQSYCSAQDHFKECVSFAKERGFVEESEAGQLEKIGSFKGPGGCVGEECRTFCDNPDNFETCISWAHDNGKMSDKQYEMAKKTGGKGPGGCVREQCNEYCQKREYMEECFKFACEKGFASSEQCKAGIEAIKRGTGEQGQQGQFVGPGGTRQQGQANEFPGSAAAVYQKCVGGEDYAALKARVEELQKRYGDAKEKAYEEWKKVVESGKFNGSFEDYAKDKLLNSALYKELSEANANLSRCASNTQTAPVQKPTPTSKVCPKYPYEQLNCTYGYSTGGKDSNGCPLPPTCKPAPSPENKPSENLTTDQKITTSTTSTQSTSNENRTTATTATTTQAASTQPASGENKTSQTNQTT